MSCIIKLIICKCTQSQKRVCSKYCSEELLTTRAREILFLIQMTSKYYFNTDDVIDMHYAHAQNAYLALFGAFLSFSGKILQAI